MASRVACNHTRHTFEDPVYASAGFSFPGNVNLRLLWLLSSKRSTVPDAVRVEVGSRMKRFAGLALIGLLLLSGCGNFFTPQTSGTTSTTTGNTAAGDVLYFMNASQSSISAYSVATTGALTAVTNSPYSIGLVPTSIAVTPGNTFLYVGTATGILGYSIGTGGVLTELNSNTAEAADVFAPVSMQVDSTGNYLMAAAENVSTTLPEVALYTINASSGKLTAATGSPYTVKAGNGTTNTVPGNAPYQLCITPNNAYVYLTLGGGGMEILTFDATNVTLADTGNHLDLLNGGSGEYGVLSNPTSTVLYVAEIGVGLRALSIATGGGLTEVTGSPFKTGNGPTGLVLDSSGDYLYVTNKGDSTISGYSLSASGGLTALGSSPFGTGSLPLAMSLDQSKKFLAVANSGGNPDLDVYAFDSTTVGKLDLVSSETATVAQGTSQVAGTH